ncbi:hypothetical protein P3T76_013360 [Phytophthora citrophthora]|uniref:Uncharacterized protein n=1 Tax=Phytophthora citrophthora TaxID=4793 RepID=A0AAD9G2Y9_9STRA|nr:hypothetical protein P3T76_013360 [Phytophthora citrophthora]
MNARFSEEELEEAIQRVLAGESLTTVVTSSAVSRTTLKCYVGAHREGQVLERQRPGPAPVLAADCEEDIVTRITAM